MAVYKCSVCGYVFDEDKEQRRFEELTECPVCKQSPDKFVKIRDDSSEAPAGESGAGTPADGNGPSLDLRYDDALVRRDESCRYMAEIHQMAVSGRSISAAMGTQMKMPDWDDILLLGAQLNPPPLADDYPVRTTTVIGKNAKKPMILSGPVYISHMSFGALSKEVKVALAKGSAMARTAMCSGEGGILPEEMEASLSLPLGNAMEVFERLPLVQDAHLLRNILYGGVWQQYYAKLRGKEKDHG